MPQAEKVVRYIAPKANVAEEVKNKYRQKRVAAYCRVSTQQEEQINSYEVQTRYYTEKINAEPKWKLVRIFADKGISGTSTKHRDEFNKMIRMCKRGRIDMIITKSKKLEIKVRLAEINEEFQKAMSLVSVDDDNNVVIEQRLTELIMERDMLNKELAKYAENENSSAQSKINEIVRLTDILENQPMQFNDELVRQILQCVVVESKDLIKVIFNDGTEIDQPILNC